jgi:hypothetical protein
MRARKFKYGFLILVSLFGPAAMAEPGAGVHTIPVAVVVADVRSPQARVAASPVQAMPPVEEIQFAGLSPTAGAQAPTVDGRTSSGRSATDLLALILVTAMLVAYQLFRKHRLLRQQPFSL